MPRIAAAAYPLSVFDTWHDYRAKMAQWVGDAAAQGAELLVFPEYGGTEIATLAGVDVAADMFAAIDGITERLDEADVVLADLAKRHRVHILAGSAPVRDGDRILNRARLIGPAGGIGVQDKLMPTPWERDALGMCGGDRITVFDTALGRIGVAICYDCEFPLLARAMVDAGAEVILAPSCTETPAGYSRVRIGAMARALESQCWTVQAPLIGQNTWSDMVESQTGAAGLFGPPDIGFPETGVLALGATDVPGWVTGDCPVAAVAAVRAGGGVRTWAHWPEQAKAAQHVTTRRLD